MILLAKVFFISLFFSFSLQANQTLHNHPYWYKLLHYENGQSTIKNKEFFLSTQGKYDPKKELDATLEFFQQENKNICKYPARFKWLNKKLNLQLTMPSCDKLNRFLSFQPQSLSIVFTSERYNSPTSIFGHTFLKIKTKSIDYAINYSATIDKKDNALEYIYKGVNGKYPSGYKLLPFSLKDYEYRSYEFRNLIEFKLKLNTDEIENIMFHLYELDGIVQDYYFLNHNCSSELIKLLDLKDDISNMAKSLKDIVIPIDIIYILEQYHLIDSISKTLSKLKVFYNYLESLTPESKKVLSLLLQHKISVNDFLSNSSIPLRQQNLIILSAIRYYEIESTMGLFQNKSIFPLVKLISLKQKRVIDENTTTIHLKENPISNKLHKLSLGYKYQKKEKYISFGYRELYRNRFDMLDKIPKNGSVEFFDFNLLVNQHNIKLDYIHLFNLESTPISSRFFQESTNRVTLGAKRILTDKKLYGFFEYTLGYKFPLLQNLYYKSDIGMGLYYNHNPLYSGFAENSLEYHLPYFISIVKFQYKTFNHSSPLLTYSYDNYFKIDKNKTLSLLVSQENQKNLKQNTVSLKFNLSF